MEKNIICPISHQIFLNPAIASDGHTYELKEISLWQSIYKTSPVTREIISEIFYVSRHMKNEVDNYLQLYPEELNNQYKTSNDYLYNVSEIKIHMKNKNYEKLLSYDNFDHKFINEEIIEECPSHILKYIIDNCSNLEACDNDGWKPIHSICRYSTPEIIRYIIDKNVDLECETAEKLRPIHFICRHSTPEMIKYIIDKNVDLECETVDKWRPVHIICRNSTPEMIKYIIDKNVNLECETINKVRPIHFICGNSSPEMIKYIIDKNVDLECKTINNDTPSSIIKKYLISEMLEYITNKMLIN